MIVTATDDGWRCITQPDHARLSHEILRLWRSDGLPTHPRRSALLYAVLEHDNGWQEADAAPRLDPKRGRPHDFMSHPHAERLDVWRRGIDRHRLDHPYVAALILEHARYLHRSRAGSPDWDGFLDELEELRPELLAEAGCDEATLRADYRWLHTADLLSLTACAGWTERFERWDRSGLLEGETLRLTPFPFAGSTAFSVPCRLLPRAAFHSDAELATALALCRWHEWTFRIAP
jgi:hypothetical protein